MIPLFSIIIPTYNSGEVIEKCISSILVQSYKNFEILIIDNQSTDGSITFLESLNDYRIKIHVDKDTGIYEAMNKGIKYSNGEWLYFLGSDDFFVNEDLLLTIAQKIASNSNLDLIYGNVYWGSFHLIYDGKFYLHKLFRENICHQAIFTKRSVILELGCFDTNFAIHADYDLILKIFISNQYKISYTDTIIAFFSLGGLSSNKKDDFFSVREQTKNKFVGSLKFIDKIYFNYTSLHHLSGPRVFIKNIYYKSLIYCFKKLDMKPSNASIMK